MHKSLPQPKVWDCEDLWIYLKVLDGGVLLYARKLDAKIDIGFDAIHGLHPPIVDSPSFLSYVLRDELRQSSFAALRLSIISCAAKLCLRVFIDGLK